MNKRIFVLPLLVALMLPGCNQQPKTVEKEMVINDKVLKANTAEPKKSIFSSVSLKNTAISVENPASFYFSDGFLQVYDEESKVYFQSLLDSKVVFGPFLLTKAVAFTTYPSSLAGGFIVYMDEGINHLCDAFGHEFDLSDYDTTNIVQIIENDDDQVLVYNSDDKVLVYSYVDGLPVLKKTLESSADTKTENMAYDSLDSFGHQGYKRYKNNGRYIIFDENNNSISSFTDPVADAKFFVGDYFIYQNSVKLDSNNNNYDYLDQSGNRYSLETYRLNYITEEVETINLNYVIGATPANVNLLFDENNIYSYVYANLRKISEKKILSNTQETFVIDSTGKLYDNITGVNFSNIVRIGPNYYDYNSYTIYNGNLEEVAILANASPSYIPNGELLICEKEGRFGAVNYQGKEMIPFEYEKIYTSYISNNSLLALKSGAVHKISFDTKNATSKVDKTYEGYSSASHMISTKGGVGVYKLTPATDELETIYLSLAGDEPFKIQRLEGSSLTTTSCIANAFDKAVFAAIEVLDEEFHCYSSLINISR